MRSWKTRNCPGSRTRDSRDHASHPSGIAGVGMRIIAANVGCEATGLRPEASMPEKIRIGLLGAGHGHAGGKLHVLEASPEFEVVGVAEANPEVRERCQSAGSFTTALWGSGDELLENRSV